MAISGKNGKAKISSDLIADVNSWTLDIATDTEEVTAMLATGVTWKTFISLLATWTGSMEMSWKVNDDADGQTALNTASLAGTTIEDLSLYPNATNYYQGDAIITNANIATDVKGKVTYSVTFQGTGALSYN